MRIGRVRLQVADLDASVGFYRDVLGLRPLFATGEGDDRLTCFEFGGAYLMVETGGRAMPEGKPVSDNCTKLRLNVPSLEAARAHLRAHGIAAEISRFDWGATIDLHDPDGNRIGIREEAAFAGHAGAER